MNKSHIFGYLLGLLIFVIGIPALMWLVSGRPWPYVPDSATLCVVSVVLAVSGLALSIIFEDKDAARETLDRVRQFIKDNPTVYCSTHSPQGYENLEAKRVMDLDNPVPTVFAEVDFSEKEASGKYVCSICGYVYDPAEHDGIAFEDLPDDWRCPRCKQGKEKFNKA